MAATDKEGGTAGSRAFEQLGGQLAGGLGTAYTNGYSVFPRDLNAGLGAGTTRALNDLGAATRGPSNVDEATTFTNGLIRGTGLTAPQGTAMTSMYRNGGAYDALLRGIPNTSAAETGLSKLGSTYGSIAGGLARKSGAETAYTGLGTRFGRIARGLSGTSAAQRKFAGLGGTYGGIADSLSGPSRVQSEFQRIGAGANNRSLTEEMLMPSARGELIGENNPHLKALLDRAAEDTSADMAAAFGSAGRFGGSGHAQDLSQSLADTRTQALYQDYTDSLDRQRSDISAIEGMRQSGLDNEYRALSGEEAARRGQLADRFSALSGEAGAIGAADDARLAQLSARLGAMDREGAAIGAGDNARLAQIATRLSALGGQGSAITAADAARRGNISDRAGLIDRSAAADRDLFSMSQQGTSNRLAASGMAAGLADAALDPARTRLGIGQVQDANTQAELLAQNDLFRRTNDAPMTNIQQIIAALGGLGGNPGVQKQTPWWQTILGAGTAAAGAFL